MGVQSLMFGGERLGPTLNNRLHAVITLTIIEDPSAAFSTAAWSCPPPPAWLHLVIVSAALFLWLISSSLTRYTPVPFPDFLIITTPCLAVYKI